MIGARKVTLGGTDYELREPEPDIYELRELPDGPILGRYTRLPAHGRYKETFRIIGTDQNYTSEKEMWYLLQSRYWRTLAQKPAPAPIPALEAPAEEPSSVPMLTVAEFAAARAVPAHRLRRLLAANALAGAQKTEVVDAQNHRQTSWIIPADAPLPANASRANESPDPAPAPPAEEPPAPPPDPEPDLTGWVSVSAAARVSGVTRAAVGFWLKDQRIRAVKRGAAWWIDPASLPQPGQTIAEIAPKAPTPDGVVIPDGWLRTSDAARAYGVSLTTVGEWAIRGKVPAIKAAGPTGNVWWIAPPAVATEPLPLDAVPVDVEETPALPEPLAEVAPPAPPTNGNGHHAAPEPVPVLHLPALDTDLLTRLQHAEREVGRLQGENAYLRAQLADRAGVEAKRGHWWSR